MNLPEKKILTVCGPIDPENLKFTLTHEHLNHFGKKSLFKPRIPDIKYEHHSNQPFNFKNKWWIDYHPYSHIDNMKFNDLEVKEAILDELNFYKSNGGSSIVECTTFGRDLGFLKNVQEKTKINIIAGAGYYVSNTFEPDIYKMSIEDIFNKIMDQFTNSKIKCGILGELGTSWPLHYFEKKVIQAAGLLSSENPTLPVNIHPGRNFKSCFETLRIFQEAGGHVDKLAISHLERTIFDDETLLEFAKFGCYCEFDLFGIEVSHYEVTDDIDMPNDAVRVQRLKRLVEEKHLNKILISQDIHTKHRLMKYGGHGYSHILMNVIPLLKRRNFTQEEINQITIHNPTKFLTF